jgi:hypothetical protein
VLREQVWKLQAAGVQFAICSSQLFASSVAFYPGCWSWSSKVLDQYLENPFFGALVQGRQAIIQGAAGMDQGFDSI